MYVHNTTRLHALLIVNITINLSDSTVNATTYKKWSFSERDSVGNCTLRT